VIVVVKGNSHARLKGGTSFEDHGRSLGRWQRAVLQPPQKPEAHEAIHRQIGDLEETSAERRKLERALEALSLLRFPPGS
jgi:hypothetical protein